MKRTVKIFALTAILGAAFAVAQNGSTPQAHKGSAETTLVGVSLFSTGQSLIAKYGSPNEIQGLALGSTASTSNSAGAQGGRGGPSAAGAPKGQGGGGGGMQAGTGADVVGDPFDTGKTDWQAQATTGPDGSGPGGGQVAGAPKGSMAGAGGGSAGGSVGGSTQGSGSVVIYTRWVYNKGASRYAFVLDKFNRVVQIEAFGLYDSRVKTRRGAMFGSSFGTLVKKYNTPDAYEINGDTIVMRYLNRDHVAFRLQRVDPKKGQVVTGIVVAAGK